MITTKNWGHACLAESFSRWPPAANWSGTSVETVRLYSGFHIVLSRIVGGRCAFQHEEREDIFGIGFHLLGGASFVMENSSFATQPLEVWAGTAPRGSTSTFSLPAHGFQTVSLRFSPATIREMLARDGCPAGNLIEEMSKTAEASVSMKRLSHLDPATVQVINAMFSTPYTGAARTLFLESCALALLAAPKEARHGCLVVAAMSRFRCTVLMRLATSDNQVLQGIRLIEW